ncbi:MAG: hypothetical protein HYX94_09730 [Chloroflexi bacterium]|nr:hypothetical protein [Chloroflexota bacterium]
MKERYGFLRNEALALAVLSPLLVISALVGLEAGRSAAAGGLSQSPISPVPTAAPPGAGGSFPQDYLWFIVLIVMLIILLAGTLLWRRRGTG